MTADLAYMVHVFLYIEICAYGRSGSEGQEDKPFYEFRKVSAKHEQYTGSVVVSPSSPD